MTPAGFANDDHRAGTPPAPPATGAAARYRWKLLQAGPLLLDGGSMFGLVPRILWQKLTPPDAEGRIRLAHNCLLLEKTGDDTSSGPRRILIETGSGDKFDAKNRAIFGLSDRSIAQAVTEAGCGCEQIDHVIVSHLHFDHAGGLTRAVREGETPDWPRAHSAAGGAGVMFTFPNAPVTVQRREWDDAIANNSVMTRTYLRENLEPIRDRLNLVDAPLPFPPGYHPARAEAPPSSWSDRQIALLPGITGFLVPGHTWGQQAILFHDDRGNTVVFDGDLMPTANHVGAAYNMAYDVEPYTSTVTRRWFLQAADDNDWLVVLSHDPDHPAQRVRPDGKGWFSLIPETACPPCSGVGSHHPGPRKHAMDDPPSPHR